ncbi:MAG: protein-L-isoaspartate(D-aspartate) O-methyltransferase [Candidatus Micrarchaeales archaeon]|nr:protein-L-isoaspartate(D-aspartate) O-methyltransferase [Candidatus Micrarchaeales archaeon]
MDEVFRQRNKALIAYLKGTGFLKTEKIISAFENIPRHLFVSVDKAEYAYDDIALPLIGESTISQPSTVAYMLERLQPKEGEKVLEIGTGSGWEACLLAYCVGSKDLVVTIEIEKDVAELAKHNIAKMQFRNIIKVQGDGSVGYPDKAPFDKIIYTAAAPDVPKQMTLQLRNGGRLVAPVGTRFMQAMKIIDKVSDKKLEERSEAEFQFVPLKGLLGF